ncbi:Kinesin-like protein KIN-14S [Turnera subulata]|uniref:Kinesin-like protein n=1 Tax=Turnera subulata TaxID=218843 RepID=A0A9Q0JGN5_9ROSI|nr:Kinesin-like protein KIN-14S [Turnera subulata]
MDSPLSDPTAEILPPKSDPTLSPSKITDQTLETETTEEGMVEETTTHSMDEGSASSESREISSAHGPTLPILQKIINLSHRIQDLKKDHTCLSDQVKAVVADSVPGPQVLDALRLLSDEFGCLKKKYLQESSERKRLYNEVIELKGNIRVFCRCRPLSPNETANGSCSVVDFGSSQENDLQIVTSDSSKKQFKFDHVFGPDDSQEAVFAQTKPIVTSVMDGYNVCIFAYGQTGTGKTFTMEGTPDNRGVNYRTLDELFRISQERTGVMKYELYVSMLEVYNEKIRDLLVETSDQPPKRLEIKQAAEGTQEVPGLVEARVSDTEEVWDILKSGSRARSVGSTSANELSSRSHCLLRVTVKGENLIDGQKTRSHLWLVDLAGSERVGKIEVEGERLKESQFINKSLSALGDVISALASKTGHVPYRNSKLTHMLQSSLGGDCKTMMFVQISPSSADLGETLCSLNFATRAEKLKHDEKETKKLQDNLQSLQLRLAAREHICRNLQEKVKDLENQLGEERKIRLKQETKAFTAVSSQPSYQIRAENTKVEKRPPLGPSKPRMPLRRITNFMPPPSPIHIQKTTSTASGRPSVQNKENSLKPRRISIAARAPPPTSTQAFQPKRRVSMATLRPESNSISTPLPRTSTQVLQPKRRVSMATLRPESSSNITTPLHTSVSQLRNGGTLGLMRDPRKARYSRLFSPLPENVNASETTPMAMRSSSKFMGSPPTQPGSWKPRHPTVVALQRKSLIWSPLKLRGMKTYRKSSLLPTRLPADAQ